MANPIEWDYFADPRIDTLRHPIWDGWNCLWTAGNGYSGSPNTSDTHYMFLSTKHSMSNGRSLGSKILDGNSRPWFHQSDRQSSFYTREVIPSPGDWEIDTYNRQRMFIRPPKGQQLGTAGSQDAVSFNMHWGNYHKGLDASDTDTESDNMHFYHHIQLLVPERWNQIIMDWHPHRQRQISTAIPLIKQYPQPDTSPGYNYFDLLTRSYYKHFYWLGTKEDEHLPEAYPAYAYYDHFEFYTDAQEDADAVNYIYCLSGVYLDDDNSFHLGFSRQAGEVSTIVEVRYSFTDAIQQNWEDLISPPNNRIISNPGARRENMTFITTDIDASGNDFVYFALKHDDYAPVRQIVIPLVDSELPPLPPST